MSKREPRTTTTTTNDGNCACMPYKDSLLISAQVLSIVGFLFSVVSAWGSIIGLVALILLQILWCCKMNKCGIITSGVFSLLTAILSLIGGIVVLANGATSATIHVVSSNGNDDCIYHSYSDTYDCYSTSTGGYTYTHNVETTATTNLVPFAVMNFLSAICWLAATVCIFIFVRGGRYEAFVTAQKEQDDDTHYKEKAIGTNVMESSNRAAYNPNEVSHAKPDADPTEIPDTTEIEYVEDLDDIECPTELSYNKN